MPAVTIVTVLVLTSVTDEVVTAGVVDNNADETGAVAVKGIEEDEGVVDNNVDGIAAFVLSCEERPLRGPFTRPGGKAGLV